jgi:predicted SprT family Zn-dependent metalloprotease
MDRAKLVSIAGELFKEHGLDARGWRLEFRRFGHLLGRCCSRRRIIAISDFYADENTEANVLDTLLHEIAHALVGPSHGHGPIWKAMAKELGCLPNSKTGIVIRPGRYQATCPTCGSVFHKYRKPRHSLGYYCPSCGKEEGRLAFSVQEVDSAVKLARSRSQKEVG